MIPLHKLAKLNRTMRLRKLANLFGKAEHRFAYLGQLNAGEIEELCEALDFLAGNENFSPAISDAVKTARQNIAGGVPEDIRRSLNAVHHILLAETGRYQADWDFVENNGVLDALKRRPFAGMFVYLEDIRSPFNVGSMFRAAESFGAEKIWLSPLCADPRHKRAERTAMGCVDVIPWERLQCDPFGKSGHADYCAGYGAAESGYDGSGMRPFLEGPFFALETGGTPLGDFSFPRSGVLIAGSEELGVSPGALAAADSSLGRVTIPTWGAKGSLNVSVAFGIVMQAWAAYCNSVNAKLPL